MQNLQQPFLSTIGQAVPDRVATRIALGIVRHAKSHGRNVRPSDVTLADLADCAPWDLLTVQGIGKKAWMFLSVELVRQQIQLRDRSPDAELLVRSAMAIQDLHSVGELKRTSHAKVEQYLELVSELVYELDARPPSRLNKI